MYANYLLLCAVPFRVVPFLHVRGIASTANTGPQERSDIGERTRGAAGSLC